MTAFVQLNSDETIVIGVFAIRQNPPAPAGYDELADNDPRVLAWNAAHDARVRDAITAPIVAQSFAACLRGRAVTLSKKGQTVAAMNLLLQAQRIDPNG